MRNIVVELDESDVRKLVYDHLRGVLGDVEFDEKDVKIETKSKQNYRSEWETAAFRARFVKRG
jgi:hypothetical protein